MARMIKEEENGRVFEFDLLGEVLQLERRHPAGSGSSPPDVIEFLLFAFAGLGSDQTIFRGSHTPQQRVELLHLHRLLFFFRRSLTLLLPLHIVLGRQDERRKAKLEKEGGE
ncbi:hypothetical protein H6P81_008913 [Aristolochia fimbriata]|uniref:Uncharacterized protein n=1 Tax=Aristolochia fimbriata TaxID=158543 RepID=A0AAV7EJK6_ARIFI|nr:hypothetical protein H6P81_008913 [Aristolochia fimbriata]